MAGVPVAERGIEYYFTPSGGHKRYRVRWRDGGRHRSKSFRSLPAARRYRDRVADARMAGERVQAAEAGELTLAEFVADVWAERARKRLTPGSWKQKRENYNRYILHQLGGRPIAEIDAEDLVEWQDWLETQVGAPTQIKVIGTLNQIFQEAGRRTRKTGVTFNPVQMLERPSAGKRRRPGTFTPEDVERVRRELIDNSIHRRRVSRLALRDACLVSLMSYAGLRPGEALALSGAEVEEKRLRIEWAISDGKRVDRTKTGQDRRVPILAPLRADLDALIEMWEIKPGDPLIQTTSGNYWNENEWRNWRRRSFREALKSTEIPPGTRPYDLGRHTHAHLRLAAGMSLPRLSEIMGHSVRVLSETYSATIEEWADRKHVDPAREINKARRKVWGKRDPSTGRRRRRT